MQAGSLNVACFNIHSIVNKLELLETFLMHSDIDLAFITESWLNAKIQIPHFLKVVINNILWDDRLHGRGGGVLLYKCSLNVN